jgi:hypothetical protein
MRWYAAVPPSMWNPPDCATANALRVSTAPSPCPNPARIPNRMPGQRPPEAQWSGWTRSVALDGPSPALQAPSPRTGAGWGEVRQARLLRPVLGREEPRPAQDHETADCLGSAQPGIQPDPLDGGRKRRRQSS